MTRKSQNQSQLQCRPRFSLCFQKHMLPNQKPHYFLRNLVGAQLSIIFQNVLKTILCPNRNRIISPGAWCSIFHNFQCFYNQMFPNQKPHFFQELGGCSCKIMKFLVGQHMVLKTNGNNGKLSPPQVPRETVRCLKKQKEK